MFLNPVMLAGLGAAALPLVLHLLSRARYRSVDWGAMMFLQGADSRQRQSTQVKQWILLAVRMAVVGLLAVTLARPVVRGSWARLTEQGNVTAVIAIDCSASMGAADGAVGARARFDEARQAAVQIVSNLRPGDQAIVLLAGIEQSDAELRPIGDFDVLSRRLAKLQPGAASADFASVLARAGELLDRYAPSNRELYLICDQQAVSWNGVNANLEDAWRRKMTSSAGPMRFTVVPVGNAERANVAIESIRLANPPAIRQQPVEVEIHVRNHGAIARTAWPVKVLRAGAELLTTTVNLPPDGIATVKLPVTFDAPGAQILTARAEPAGPPADDTLSTVVEVTDPVRVLIISGDERAGPFESESDFARAALMPFQTAGAQPSGANLASVDVVPADKWQDVDVHAYAVVILANVSQVTDVQARSLEQFVLDGGGLLIAPGSLSRAQNYNDMLASGEGANLLPATLDAPREQEDPTHLFSVDREHPAFRFLRNDSSPLPSAAIARRFLAAPRSDFGRVLATYRTGEPFLVGAMPGRGRVLLLTTPLDADWNALPLSNFYLPFVQSMTRYLAGDASDQRNLLPGQPIGFTFEPGADDAAASSATMARPDGTRVIVNVRRAADHAEVRYENTRAPGQYVLNVTSADGARSIPFVVRPPPAESDLTPLNEQQWDRLEQALMFDRVSPDGPSLAQVAGASRSARETWPFLLAIVIVLAVGELLLARLWSEEQAP
jgi:hypothetical protein